MPRKARELPWVDTREGTYYVNWYDPSSRRTKRLSLGTKEAGEAQARFAAFLREGADHFDPNTPAPKPAGITVRGALADYLRDHVDAGKVADPVRAHDAADNLRAFFGDTVVSTIDIPLCRSYAYARRSAEVAKTYRDGKTRIPAGDGTIRRELVVLTAAINHAVKWKRLAKADVPYIEKPTIETGLAPWLFPDELDRLRGAASGRVRSFIEVAYYTAARRESVEQLTLFQVDTETWQINLSPAGDRSTVKRRGIVPIDEALRPTVTRLVAEAKAAGSEYLLGAPHSVYRHFIRAAEAAGVLNLPARGLRPEASISPHVLRHSRATHLLQQGKSPWAVANLLHDTVLTVIRTYGHACPEHVREALLGKGGA